MGFHVILKHNSNEIKYAYAQDEIELAKLPISIDSIIYQGEERWRPMLVKDSSQYKRFSKPSYRVGILAQELFKKQALKKEYILEELNQDQESMKAYTNATKEYIPIKRGDFLLRNAGNYEIDVKCRFFIENKKGQTCFEFNVDHLERHLNMWKKFTKTPVIIAVYDRDKINNSPREESLHMIDVEHMKNIVKKHNLKKMPRKNNGERYQVYQIPVDETMKEFDLISYLFKKKK